MLSNIRIIIIITISTIYMYNSFVYFSDDANIEN